MGIDIKDRNMNRMVSGRDTETKKAKGLIDNRKCGVNIVSSLSIFNQGVLLDVTFWLITRWTKQSTMQTSGGRAF